MLPIVTLHSHHLLKLALSATWRSYYISLSHFLDGCFILSLIFLKVLAPSSLLSLAAVTYIVDLTEKLGAENFHEYPLLHLPPPSICVYEVCPEGIRPCNMKNRDIHWRRYRIQETLFIGQWHLSLLQVSMLGSHTVLPIAISCPIVFSWISSMVWNLLTFKGDLVLGKARSRKAPNLGCSRAESPGWFDVLPKLCMRHDTWVGMLLW